MPMILSGPGAISLTIYSSGWLLLGRRTRWPTKPRRCLKQAPAVVEFGTPHGLTTAQGIAFIGRAGATGAARVC